MTTMSKSEGSAYEECGEMSRYKCESKSFYRTCGYPAANPNSNLNAYCNEMRAYIRCARCKTKLCKLFENVDHINKQEEQLVKFLNFLLNTIIFMI